MKHEESRLQKQCVAWFRAQYPEYAMLLTHPANEGNGNRVSGAIHKAEGTMKGVPDLLLFMSAGYRQPCPDQKIELIITYFGLGIEFKTQNGRQSQEQKDFQQMFEAAGYKYVIVRSFEEFRDLMNEYIIRVSPFNLRDLAEVHSNITKAAEEREKEKFYKVIGKK